MPNGGRKPACYQRPAFNGKRLREVLQEALHPGRQHEWQHPEPLLDWSVMLLAGSISSESRIAKRLGIGPDTLRRHYGHWLDAAKFDREVAVTDELYYQATAHGNVSACIAYGKIFYGWKDNQIAENIPPDWHTMTEDERRARLAELYRQIIAGSSGDRGESALGAVPQKPSGVLN